MSLSEELCEALGWGLLAGDPCHMYSWRQDDVWTPPYKLSLDVDEEPHDFWREPPDFEGDPRAMTYLLHEMSNRGLRLCLTQNLDGTFHAAFGEPTNCTGFPSTCHTPWAPGVTVHLAVARASLAALRTP